MKVPKESLRVTKFAPRLKVLSNSALTCASRCLREYQYRYILLRRPNRVSEALRFGSFFDQALGAWWGAKRASERLPAALLVMRETAASRPEDGNPYDLIKAEELMLGYTARWGDEGYETISVQQEFDVPLTNPSTGFPSRTYRLRGKMDALARLDGRVYQVEHKTTSRDITQGSDYWRRVSALDPQVSTYQAAATASGFDVHSCLYDVIRKVSLRPKMATPVETRRYTTKGFLDVRQRLEDETPEEFRLRVRADIEATPEKYYARGPVVRLERDVDEHASDVWQRAWILRESELADRWPRSPNACERFGSLCDFFDVCSGTASIDDATRFRTAETAHEELSREV